jgi:hypothetical protein
LPLAATIIPNRAANRKESLTYRLLRNCARVPDSTTDELTEMVPA